MKRENGDNKTLMLRRLGVLWRSGVVCRGYGSVPNNITKLIDSRLEKPEWKDSKKGHRPAPKLKKENGTTTTSSSARSFDDIVNDMNARKLQEDEMLLAQRDTVRRLSSAVGTKKRASYLDITSGLQIGDLVQSQRHGICVIVGTATGNDNVEEICICTISGTVKQVRTRDIALKLERFAPAELFQDATCEIMNGNGQPMKVLKSDVRLAVCGPLREFYRGAHARAPAIRNALDDVLSHLAKADKPMAIPFFELCRIVQYVTFTNSQYPEKAKDPRFYKELFTEGYPLPHSTTKLQEAVPSKVLYMTYQMIELVFNNRALLDTNTVTVLSQKSVDMANSALQHIKSKEVVDRINDMLGSPESDKKLEGEGEGNVATKVTDVLTFLKRYALRDFNDLDTTSHSAAISLLRHLSPFQSEYISFETALAVQTRLKNLDEYHGPQIESERFSVITNEFKSALHPANMIEKYPDSMEAVRTKDSAGRRIYCIDSSDADEIDDGISIMKNEDTGKWRMGVHIADPSSALMTDDRELNKILNRAYKLCSTLYMPQESVSMLPDEFKRAFGLIKETAAPRRCLSFEFDYDPEKCRIDEDSIDVKPLLVENIVSLTYEQADQMLREPRTSSPQHADLHDLHSVGGKFREFRKRNGMLTIDIQSYSARVQDDCDVELVENKSLESSKTVSEMMIMANYLTAGYTKTNNIPNIYRAQTLNFTEEVPLSVRMKMATLSAVPFAHESLGLRYYTNVTSPLRRFQDLIGHWQIEAHLSNKNYPLFDRSQMFTMATWLHSNQSTMNQAQRQSNAYWKLRKIHSLPKDTQPLFECTLFRNSPRINGSQMVYCTSWGMDAMVYGMPNDISINDTFKCTLRAVYPTQYRLELQFQSKT